MVKPEPAVVICGIGQWGRNLLQEFARVTTVASVFGVGNRKNRKWVIENYPTIPITNNLEELLKRRDASAVIIATPPNTHTELALAALRENKHVFVEKPLSTQPDQLKRLYDEAAKRKLCIFVGHIFLHHPVFDYLLKRHTMSPWQEVHFNWNKFGSFRHGIVENLFVHDLAIAQRLFGATMGILLEEAISAVTDADKIRVKMIFDNEVVCYSHINRVSSANIREVAFRSQAENLIWNGNCLFRINRRNQCLELEYEATEQALTRECQEFLNRMDDSPSDANEREFEQHLARALSDLLSSIKAGFPR